MVFTECSLATDSWPALAAQRLHDSEAAFALAP